MSEYCKICLIGNRGKMGQSITAALNGHASFILNSGISRETPKSDWNTHIQDADSVLDFSHPAMSAQIIKILEDTPRPYLLGTTGFDGQIMHRLEKISKLSPVLIAPNTSISMTLFNYINCILSKAMIPLGFDCEILETHHRSKKDAPSGTALWLASHMTPHIEYTNRNELFEKSEKISGRIGFSSRRGGKIPGTHTVSFIGDDEMIELTHTAFNRAPFVHGAISALAWLIEQPSGLYSMTDFWQDTMTRSNL